MPTFGSSADEPKTNERLIKSSNKKLANKKQRYNKLDQEEDEDDNSSMEDDSDDQNNGDQKYEDAELDGKYREEEGPAAENKKGLPRKVSTSKKLSPKMNQEEDDDEYYDDDYEENEKDADKSTSTTTTTTTETPLEHYYSHFDSKNEHNLFKLAEDSLKKIQLDKMKKVFKDYAEFQTRLSEKNIKKSKSQKKSRLTGDADPEMDESLRKKMEKRYEDALESLEMQNNEEKQQLNAMHQQRVLTLINMKKQEATDCYTSSLNQTPLKPRKIQKCLEKLMKSLEKDRIHTLHHYKHLLQVSSKLALKEKAATLTHLENLIVIANRSISMLNKYPTLNDKIRNHIIAFWHNLRGVPFNQVISRETEQQIMEKYEEEIAQKQQEKEHRKMLQEVKKEEEKERELKSGHKSDETKPQADHNKPADKSGDKPAKQPMDQQSSESNSSADRTTTSKANAPANVKYTVRHSTNSKLNGKQQAASQPHQQTKPAVANMQHSRQHHETSFKLSEQLPEQHHLSGFKLEQHSAGTWMGIAGIFALLAAVCGVVLWRSSSSSHILSQGFVALQQQQTNAQQQMNNREQDQVEALQVSFFGAEKVFQFFNLIRSYSLRSFHRPPDTRTRLTVFLRTRT